MQYRHRRWMLGCGYGASVRYVVFKPYNKAAMFVDDWFACKCLLVGKKIEDLIYMRLGIIQEVDVLLELRQDSSSALGSSLSHFYSTRCVGKPSFFDLTLKYSGLE